MNLRSRIAAIQEVLPTRSFTFVNDACRGLEQARKVGAVGKGVHKEAKRGAG